MAFNYRTWASSWGTSWASSWGQTTTVEVVDKHDGERKRRKWEEQRQAKERLREQIRQAIDGPDAPIIAPALERIAQEGSEPLHARVDIGELVAQAELWRSVREAAMAYARREQAIADDDDEILMLL